MYSKATLDVSSKVSFRSVTLLYMQTIKERFRWGIDQVAPGNIKKAAAVIGVSRATLYAWMEGDVTNIRAMNLASLCQKTGKSQNWYLFGTEDAPASDSAQDRLRAMLESLGVAKDHCDRLIDEALRLSGKPAEQPPKSDASVLVGVLDAITTTLRDAANVIERVRAEEKQSASQRARGFRSHEILGELDDDESGGRKRNSTPTTIDKPGTRRGIKRPA